MISHYRCPLCHQPLFQGGVSYRCNQNHQFDIAKEGYVNLLPVQNKKSKQPGDNAEMVAARRAFFDTDHYHFLRDYLAHRVAAAAPNTVLDLGCGEGFYTQAIAQQCNSSQVYGVDIAKTAIRYAAKRYHQVNFSVASIKDAPFEDNFADAIVSVFAPVFAEELARLANETGKLIVVAPGPRHLFELKSLIYDQVKLHSMPPVPEGFALDTSKQLEQTQTFDFECAQNLVMMTPFAWKFKPEHYEHLEKLGKIDITLSFVVSEYHKV